LKRDIAILYYQSASFNELKQTPYSLFPSVMEPISLALGVVVLIKPLAETIREIWADGKNFGGDAERLRIRFSVQITRLDSFQRVLFEPNKFPLVQGTLFEQLPQNVCEDFVDLLRQLYDMMQQYLAVQKKYALENREDRGLVEQAALMTVEDRMSSLTISGKAGDAKQARAISWIKKTWWVMGDKKSAEKLVVEFEDWTERVRSLLELVWWPLPFFSTVSQMEKLEKDPDAGQIGMLEGIGMRKLLVAGSSEDPGKIVNPLRKSRLEFQKKSQFEGFEVGVVAHNTNVIVEYKSYEQDRTGSINEIVSRRILQLVALLHEAKDNHFRVLRFNFFDDTPQKRIGFAFELPTSLMAVNLVPTSLTIKLASKKDKPSLGVRVKLAHALAESLGLLHSVGWVHKSLRSENILFFPNPGPQKIGNADSDKSTSTAKPEIESANDLDVLLERPRILGFDYSRLESDFSSGRPDYEIKRNIYRHPKRWGQPSEVFSKIHDIYGMSLVSSLRRPRFSLLSRSQKS
jgi:hypothetical protein